MRREIIGIMLFFLVVFTLVSLMSYSPEDVSVFHRGASGRVENFFGLFGAHLAGLLIGLFGVGAFWIPVLFLIASIEFFKSQPVQHVMITSMGGLILVVATGSLFGLYQDDYLLLGRMYSAGGAIGHPITQFLMKYSNWTGATVILILFLIIGFILSTDLSVVETGKKTLQTMAWVWRRTHFLFIKLLGALKQIYEIMRSVRAKWINRKKAPQPLVKVHRQKKTLPPPVEKPVEIQLEPVEPRTVTIRESIPPKPLRSVPILKQQEFETMKSREGFQLPLVEFLKDAEIVIDSVDHENLRQMSKLLEQKLDDFGVRGKVVTVLPGPVVTRFEFEPAPGIKINKVVNLSDDLALALRALSIRIIAPIPGKAVIGIEVPNVKREIVVIKDIIVSSAFDKSKSKLTLAMGKDIVGNPIVADLEVMPHLLIAGATGTGKSVALNTMITSILYKATPEEVKFIMIDPKRIELSVYDGIPHLITPVVTDMKKATNALFWAVREMERRYKLLSEARVRNIRQYNRKTQKTDSDQDRGEEPTRETLPYIVIIIDELADLMMVASRDVEVSLTRLAQMARAAGIHLILATQRPSVDILTGIIKANFPTRLSFQVSSKIDSRTIIDANGAETLLGKGDMLFLPPGTAKLQRIHGAYISEEELTNIIEFLKAQKPPEYNHAIVEVSEPEEGENGDKDYDERYDEAVALVTRTGQASISMIQRHLRIGYNRAARIVEMMEAEGVVGPSDGIKPREVLVRNYDDIK